MTNILGLPPARLDMIRRFVSHPGVGEIRPNSRCATCPTARCAIYLPVIPTHVSSGLVHVSIEVHQAEAIGLNNS